MTMTVATWTEQDSLALSVVLVANDGHNMRLRGQARKDALLSMIARGVDNDLIAVRLRLSQVALQRYANREGIQLPKPQQPWWVGYAQPSQTSEHRSSRRHAQRAREGAGR